MKTEFQIIAEIFSNGRRMFNFYLKKVPLEQLNTRLEMNGKLMNSAYWVTCHTIWAEKENLLEATGGPVPYMPFLDSFGMGKEAEKTSSDKPWEEVLQNMELVHNTAITWLKERPDTELEDEVPGLLGKSSTVRKTLYHAIRHEGVHTGQLAWIAAALGQETP